MQELFHQQYYQLTLDKIMKWLYLIPWFEMMPWCMFFRLRRRICTDLCGTKPSSQAHPGCDPLSDFSRCIFHIWKNHLQGELEQVVSTRHAVGRRLHGQVGYLLHWLLGPCLLFQSKHVFCMHEINKCIFRRGASTEICKHWHDVVIFFKVSIHCI